MMRARSYYLYATVVLAIYFFRRDASGAATNPPASVAAGGELLKNVADEENEEKFCGELKIFQQKWFAASAITLASQRTANLSECIRQCCAVRSCNAITYVGFLSKHANASEAADLTMSDYNCFWFKCDASNANDLQCGGQIGAETPQLEAPKTAREGVLSILILDRTKGWTSTTRTTTTSTTLRPQAKPASEEPDSKEDGNTHLFPQFVENSANETRNTSAKKFENNEKLKTFEQKNQATTTRSSNAESSEAMESDVGILPTKREDAFSTSTDFVQTTSFTELTQDYDDSSTTIHSYSNNTASSPAKRKSGELASLWVFGLAIVAGVVFGGLILACVGAYLCYKSRRVRMRSTPFKNAPAPSATLHAFNPPHTTAQPAAITSVQPS